MITLDTADLSKLNTLKAGDIVSVSGTVYTARDAAHKKIDALIKEGKPLPFPIENVFIYYTGATPAKEGEPIGSCGPTTSKRMDKYTPTLLDLGVKGIIGKGARGEDITVALKRNNAVYLAAIGGAGAYYKAAVKSCEIVAFPELLSEAVYKLTVSGFRCVVATDGNGNSIY